MPADEKQINNILLDQLTIPERPEQAHAKGNFEEEAKKIRTEIERKLYQKPPLSE